MINQPVIQNNIFRILSKIPFRILERLSPTELLIPYYHMISDEEILHVKHLYEYKTIRDFKKDVDFLLKKYSPISLIEILELIKKGRPLPEKVFLMTFDDGFREMYDVVAPILIEKGISATFFINSAFIDNKQMCYLNKASLMIHQFTIKWSKRLEQKLAEILHDSGIRFYNIKDGILSIPYQKKDILDDIAVIMNINFEEYLFVKKPYLSSSQINKLIEQGFTIGAHSIDHPLYALISLEDQIHQTIESLKYIRDKFQLNYGVFAFPHSDHNVSIEFFKRLLGSGLSDLSFGTAGLMNDSISNHYQRFSLEKPNTAAEKIVAFQYARKMIKHLMQSDTITRE